MFRRSCIMRTQCASVEVSGHDIAFENRAVCRFLFRSAALAVAISIWLHNFAEAEYSYVRSITNIGPLSVAFDPSGNIWISGFNQPWAVEEFTPLGSLITRFGLFGSGPGKFDYPGGIALDASGNVFVSDADLNCVQEFTSSGTFIRSFGTPTDPVRSLPGELHGPRGLAIDSSGNVWVADSLNYRVQEFDSNGNYLKQIGAPGMGDGQLDFPVGIATDPSGNIWVSDTNRIEQFSSAGTYLSQFGSSGIGNGQFANPFGISFDAVGNFFVVDLGNHRVQKFTSDGTYLDQFGTRGAGNGQFDYPFDVAVDPSGNVWVADPFNGRLQEFSSVPEPASVVLLTLGTGLLALRWRYD